MSRSVSLFIITLFAAAGALAILPPDASTREPEIRAKRIRNRKEYEERIEQRQQRAIRAYERVQKEMEVPPWKWEQAKSSRIEKERRIEAAKIAEESKQKKVRFLVSIVLLILIGSAVGWVKSATNENE